MGKGCGDLGEGAGKAAEVQGNRRDRGRGKLRGIFGGVSGKSCGQRVVESWLAEFPTQVQPENGAVLRGGFGV